VRLCDDPIAATALPESMLHYVLRVRESVILDDAAAILRSMRSLHPSAPGAFHLCLPLINRGKLIGVL